MKTTSLLCGLTALALAGELSAKEYPLTFKSLSAEEAAVLPGSYGVFAQLRSAKPPELKREPAGASKLSVYGLLPQAPGRAAMVFRIDAATGESGGHDRLMLDLNGNGDLTDDPVIKLADTPHMTRGSATVYETGWFGPFQVPAKERIAPGTPVYYAQFNYYRASSVTGVKSELAYLGTLRMRPGFLLETTVDLGGVQQKIAIVDGNANCRLGDESKPVISQSSGSPTWYFQPADNFLLDRDSSGKYESGRMDAEVFPFGPVLTLGATPLLAKLTANCAALDLEPWAGAAAQIAVQPAGLQVREVKLAWERAPKDWVLLKAGLNQGRASVPPGVLCFNGCVLEAKTRDGSQLLLSGTYNKMDKAVRATAGQTATLTCGGPLEVQLSATKRGSGTGYYVDIQAEVLGRGGETYSSFLTGNNLNARPVAPQFTIKTREGKQVASGNLEYG